MDTCSRCADAWWMGRWMDVFSPAGSKPHLDPWAALIKDILVGSCALVERALVENAESRDRLEKASRRCNRFE